MFYFCAYSREIIDVVFGLTKSLALAFGGTLFNLPRGLAVHTRFDHLDFISRSQVCQNHKLQAVFRFLSTVV